MEIGVVSETTHVLTGALKGLTEAVRDMSKNQDKLMTRVAKLEINKGGTGTSGRRSKWTEDGRPICNHCQKPGHIKAECYQLKAESKK